MIAIGIDPGIRAFGYGMLWRQSANKQWAVWRAGTVRTDTSLPLHERLRALWAQLEVAGGYILEDLVIAVEDQTGAAEGHRRRGTTSTDAVLVQQVVGMVRGFAFSLGRYKPRFVEVTPQEAKRVLPGIRGDATKAQVQRAIRAIVKDCPKVMSEHASDAVAIALAGSRKALR